MELIDIGVNLTHESFSHDLDDVLARAAAVGVHRHVVTGTTVQATRDALALHARWPHRLFATAGVHPHHAAEYDAATGEALRELVRQPGIVAVGECGLDYFRDFSPRPAQREAFAAQLEIAVETGLPVFLHQRDAHEDFMAVLKDYLPRLKAAVAHCFTGQKDELHAYLDLGLYVGITGWICDERRGAHLLQLVRDIPRDRLLVETDSPYLTPRDMKPQPKARRNEPAFLPHIVKTIARALGRPAEDVAVETTRNARALFNIL